jgi:hypothetical protein
MATEEKNNTISGMTPDEYAKFAEATILGPTKIKNLQNRLKKEQKKLDKLISENQNLFYGQEADTAAISAQEQIIQNLTSEIEKEETSLETTVSSAKRSELLYKANQDAIEAAKDVEKLKVAAQQKEDVFISGGKGFVFTQKPTTGVISAAEQKLKDAEARVKQIETGKTAEEMEEEASDVKAQRGSGGTQATDFGTVSGVPREDITPLMDGMVNIGTIKKPTVISLPGGGTISRPDKISQSKEPQTTDFATGLFYSTSAAGQEFRNKIRETLAVSGITDVSESKLESYFKDSLIATSAANQADNPNQTIFDTLAVIAKSSSGLGTGTGPSAQVVKTKKESIKLLSTQLGVTLTDNQINDLAYRFANGELDASTINFRIAKIGEIDFAAGEAANTLNELKTKASEFGILYGNDWYNQSARKILTGEIDQDTINQQIRDLAKSQFPTLSAQIDEGYTVKQIASPYIQSMAAILEIDPTTIGLQDLSIKQALTGVDMDGKPNTKPLWMFEQDLRKDPRWNYTKNAQEATMGVARKVLQDFGLAY